MWQEDVFVVARNQRFWHTWKRFLFFINKVAEKNRNMALL